MRQGRSGCKGKAEVVWQDERTGWPKGSTWSASWAQLGMSQVSASFGSPLHSIGLRLLFEFSFVPSWTTQASNLAIWALRAWRILARGARLEELDGRRLAWRKSAMWGRLTAQQGWLGGASQTSQAARRGRPRGPTKLAFQFPTPLELISIKFAFLVWSNLYYSYFNSGCAQLWTFMYWAASSWDISARKKILTISQIQQM